MKAISVNLETEVYLTSKERDSLAKNSLYGILRFYSNKNYKEIRKDIPISLTLDTNQNKEAELEIIPYQLSIGDAEKLKYKINKLMYIHLLAKDECKNRSLGLYIFAENIK